MSINENKDTQTYQQQQQHQSQNSAAYVRVGSYDLLGTIGKGNFSVCKLAQNRLTSQRFAIKCIEKKNLDTAHLTRIYREIEIMKSLDHANIIKLYQVMESKSMLYLVCEYASNGEIFEYIFKNGAMNEKMACQKFCQILSAVEYCHLKNIVHRDLKSENLLLDSNMNIKLADFGFANYFDYNRTLSTFCGSPPYAAPEIFMGKKYYGPEIDIWSLGVILYVLVSASLPFDSENLQNIKQKVLTSKYRVPYFMSQDCEDLINNLLVVNSSKRYKMQQIKSHRWIKINNSSYYCQVNNNGNNTNASLLDTSEPKNKDRIKSKSLKLVGNRASKQNTQKPNLAISSLSLPLYSFDIEENDPSQNTNILPKPDLAKLDSNLNQSDIIADLKTTSSNLASSCQLVDVGLAHNIRRYSEFISSYQSSVDEGVESDWSSSLSSDLMSITSSNSIQSFYLKKSSTQSSSTQPSRNKSLLHSAFLFSRKQKFRATKLADAYKSNTRAKNSFDLREIKHELNCLQLSVSNIKDTSKNNKISQDINVAKKQTENKPEFSLVKSSSHQIEDTHNSLKKFKQLLFLNNSKKKLISTNNSSSNNNNNNNKSKIFLKQKSSSLNSINNEDIVKESLNTNEDSNTQYRVHKFKFTSLRKYSLNKLV